MSAASMPGRFIPARAGNASADGHYAQTRRFIPARAGNAAGRRMAVMLMSRFIPARAGNAIARAPLKPASAAVHPRACGERWTGTSVLRLQSSGSSPRVRGTPRSTPSRRLTVRFIPARAGNALSLAGNQSPCCGSSPRVRGTLADQRTKLARASVHPRACGERSVGLRSRRGGPRFIPARAGNAICSRPTRCGMAGSSPRVRGTPVRADVHIVQHRRFIPARAGNASAIKCKSDVRHRFIPARAGNAVLPALHPAADRRFIPARAGNATHRVTGRVPCDAVHPRACGERSSCKRLCQRRIHDVKQRTDVPLPSSRLWFRQVDEIGAKLTSRKPSKSTGMRRLCPQVSKSKPASFGAAQAMTALPSPIALCTCSQIISRVRRE